MRQITILFASVGIIILIGCNLTMTLEGPISILCAPLSFGIAMMLIVTVLDRKKTYYYDNAYYDNTSSLLTQKMYEKDTVGDVIISRIGATVGMGLVFFIIHSIINITPIFIDTTIPYAITESANTISSFTNFAIDSLIISVILFIGFAINYSKKLFTKSTLY